MLPERQQQVRHHLLDETLLVFTLTRFESFDTLAGPARTPEAVTPLIRELARGALGLQSLE